MQDRKLPEMLLVKLCRCLCTWPMRHCEGLSESVTPLGVRRHDVLIMVVGQPAPTYVCMGSVGVPSRPTGTENLSKIFILFEAVCMRYWLDIIQEKREAS